MSVLDSSAIERIATPDLTSDALALIEAYSTNDDVIFFLGRLVCQGAMVDCAPALALIAGDPSRREHARIAAIRGVMAVGDAGQKERLWETIAADSGPLHRAVLAELFDWVAPTLRGIEMLLRAIEHAAPLQQFNTRGVDFRFQGLIIRLPLMSDKAPHHPLGCLVEGLSSILERNSLIEYGERHVSEEFAWLLPPALHAVDRLVAARSFPALSPAAISVLLMASTLKYRNRFVGEYENALSKNVPRWPVLNDLLYWASIADKRALLARQNQPLVDDWQVSYLGHFWGFGPEDFERCLEWVGSKKGDDRFVAFSLCVRIYIDRDRPAAWFTALTGAVGDDKHLETILYTRLNPKLSPDWYDLDAEDSRWKRKHELLERRQKKGRAGWIRALEANPDRILHPSGIKPGELSSDQYHLLVSSMSTTTTSTNRHGSADWQGLIPEFGMPVARAYRDASVAHWRAYRPELRSEGANSSSTPYALIFAITGLAIEASEDSAFALRLTQDEARLAFRYITWELNGFPPWFEQLYRVFPEVGRKAVELELRWELQHGAADRAAHSIIHDIFYYAPWLHRDVSLVIIEWLTNNEVKNADRLRYCLNILTSGETSPQALAKLAAAKVENTTCIEQRPSWFALWVNTDPASAIPQLDLVLGRLSPKIASDFAQDFIIELHSDRHGTGMRVGAYRNAKYLKTLYILMHRFIRVAEDIERAGKGSYSPTLRDDAQEARSMLFNMLVEVPGSEAYQAIKALEAEHPEPRYRRWMAVQARERATKDADEPAWTVEKVRAFEGAVRGQ
ncbi:hypothetical protein [Lichenihabitans psoromatis]|uniref:hypothetical protein n=1 Tax=Lichenihabitans psoromatis TaxID=2528642 RepID=UPI001035B2E4|nr:hypothetical protein [Lichenihabitans psoromatis]